jgi:hypothetical protein
MSGFMSRIIGKTERMPTIHAHIFGKTAALRQKVDEVARNDADGGMANPAPHLDLLQERMTAEAGVLLESVARRDVARAMSEQTAEVADLLLEGRRRRIRIALRIEQQRMPALRADVFVTAVAIGELLVIVLAEKTRQRVTNAGDRAIFGEVFGSATAAPPVTACLLEDVVVNVMAPQETRHFG